MESNIKVSSETIKTLVEKLRESLGRDHVTQSMAYEAIAHLAGFRGWAEMSALMKRDSPAPAPVVGLKSPVVLYLEAFSTHEFGEDPDYAAIELTEDSLRELQKLAATAELANGGHIALFDDAVSSRFWWSEDIGTGWDNGSLYVSKDRFWLRVVPKHGSIAVESRAVAFTELLPVLSGGEAASTPWLAWCDGTLFFSRDGAYSFACELVEDKELPEFEEIDASRLDFMPKNTF